MKIYNSDFHDYYDSFAKSMHNDGIEYNRKTKKLDRQPFKAPPPLCGFYLDSVLSILRIGSIIIPIVEYNDKVYTEPSEELYIDHKFGYNRRNHNKWFNAVNDSNFNSLVDEPIELYYDIKTVWSKHKEDISYIRILNPQVSNYTTKLDVYTIYQEIMMFLASRANPEPAMIQIEDKYRIEQHGFDIKESFRHRKP